jgi:hypothetical protein
MAEITIDDAIHAVEHAAARSCGEYKAHLIFAVETLRKAKADREADAAADREFLAILVRMHGDTPKAA